MFNLMKMNIYKIIHMKSFYILPLLMAVICFSVVSATYSMSDTDNSDETDVSVSEELDDISEELEDMVPESEKNTDSSEQLEEEKKSLVDSLDSMIAGGFITMLIGIGAAFVASTDYKNGFIKNYAGQVSPKGVGPVAKIPAMILESILMLAAVCVSLTLSGLLFCNNFILGSAGDLFRVLGMQVILCTAFSSLIIFFATLTRSSTLAVVISIYLCSGISVAVVNMLNTLIHKYLDVSETFDLGAYTLERYAVNTVSKASSEFVSYALIAAAAYLIISSVASFIVVRKRDV